MGVSTSSRRGESWCRLLCWILVIAVPMTLLGQSPGAILHTEGGVWVNGSEARDSTAIFSGDVIETKSGFSASLTLDGSSVQIQAESVLKFQGDFLVLDHGGVAVGTSRSFRVKVNCITVTPVQNEWTQYEVTDVNRTVHVAARKLDVNVTHELKEKKPGTEIATDATNGGSVHEGEEKDYDESVVCGPAAPPANAANGINPKWIAVGAGAGGIVIICALLCHSGGGGQKNLSQASP